MSAKWKWRLHHEIACTQDRAGHSITCAGSHPCLRQPQNQNTGKKGTAPENTYTHEEVARLFEQAAKAPTTRPSRVASHCPRHERGPVKKGKNLNAHQFSGSGWKERETSLKFLLFFSKNRSRSIGIELQYSNHERKYDASAAQIISILRAHTNLHRLWPQLWVLVNSVYIHHHSHSLRQGKILNDKDSCACAHHMPWGC